MQCNKLILGESIAVKKNSECNRKLSYFTRAIEYKYLNGTVRQKKLKPREYHGIHGDAVCTASIERKWKKYRTVGMHSPFPSDRMKEFSWLVNSSPCMYYRLKSLSLLLVKRLIFHQFSPLYSLLGPHHIHF